MKNNKKGFTLIELLVVIAIIGLLSTLAVVSLNGARTKARDAKKISDVKAIQTAMEMYKNDMAGDFPAATSMATNLTQYIQGGVPSSGDYFICASGTKYIVGALLEATPTANPGGYQVDVSGTIANSRCIKTNATSSYATNATLSCTTANKGYCNGETL